jgi:hypothetical protein
VLVRHLPADSVLWLATGSSGWRTGDYLLADLFHLWAEKDHPADPRTKRRESGASVTKLADFRRRAAARRQRLGIEGSVLRRG